MMSSLVVRNKAKRILKQQQHQKQKMYGGRQQIYFFMSLSTFIIVIIIVFVLLVQVRLGWDSVQNINHQQQTFRRSNSKNNGSTPTDIIRNTNSIDTKQLLNNRQNNNKTNRNEQYSYVTIGHVISLIKCHKKIRVQGLLDSLVILKHSIHVNSAPYNTESNYTYQMIALIHQDDKNCIKYIPYLQRIGYIPKIRNTPVNISSILYSNTSSPYRSYYIKHVENENCCGSKEFIKLYAYTFVEYPIVVHWDIDTIVLKPLSLDVLFNAMLYDKHSVQGQQARINLMKHHLQKRDRIMKLQQSNPITQQQKADDSDRSVFMEERLPDRIDAFYTRDVTSSKPWEPIQPIQGGFLVVRPNQTMFQLYQNTILYADYRPGYGNGSGWGGYGYSHFQGAMAYQGIVAYMYDVIVPQTSIELDVCRWNQVVADIIWRGPVGEQYIGQCRQYPKRRTLFNTSNDNNTTSSSLSLSFHHNKNTPEYNQCEDCRIVPIDEIHTVHYTACKKPWDCTLPYPRIPLFAINNKENHTYRLQELTNVTTCGLLFRKYFDYRYDIETNHNRIGTTEETTTTITKTNSVQSRIMMMMLNNQPDRFSSTKQNEMKSSHYCPQYFRNYCKRQGKYIPMNRTMFGW